MKQTISKNDPDITLGPRDLPKAGRKFDYLSGGLFLIAIAGYLLIGLHWLRPVDFVLWLVFSLIAALPGWALWRIFGGQGSLRRLESWTGGMIFGWAISSYVILVIGYLTGSVCRRNWRDVRSRILRLQLQGYSRDS